MKNINLKINPYFWFNKKNLIYLRSLIPLSSNNEYAIKLINDRIEVLENILEQSSFLEKKLMNLTQKLTFLILTQKI